MEEPLFWCCTAFLLFLCGQTNCTADIPPKLTHFFSLYNLLKSLFFFFFRWNNTLHTTFLFLNFCFHGFYGKGLIRDKSMTPHLYTAVLAQCSGHCQDNADDTKMILPSWIISGYWKQKLTWWNGTPQISTRRNSVILIANICKMSGKEEAEGKPYCSLQLADSRF